MDSRERVFLTLEHQESDRVPYDFWASAGLRTAIEHERGMSFDDFLDAQDVDLRYIAGPRYVGPPLDDRDVWGVQRQTVEVPGVSGTERYSEVLRPPLADVDDVDGIAAYGHWPQADWFDYGGIKAQCARVKAKGRVVVFMGDRLNRIAQLKPAMYLRGVDTILMDMAIRPAIAHAILSRIRGFYTEYLARILDAAAGGIDIVLTGDDFGMQAGLLMSPTMWETFLGDGFAAYNALIKAAGVRTMHHTCGAVAELIPQMIERGLDILQSVQPDAVGMDAAGLKARFGERLCFHGGISIQQTMPRGTPESVRRDVQCVRQALGQGGGLILCTAHNIQTDTPMANVRALLDAYRSGGAH
jgi:uroporphyrinogen decarboxylase